MKQLSIIPIAASFVLAVSGCQIEECVTNSTNYHIISARLENSGTRAIMEEIPNSLNLVTKWQGHEHINVFYMMTDSYHSTKPTVQVSEITDDGFGATFKYKVPEEWDKSDVYDVKLFTTPCFPKLVDNKIYYNASIIREPIAEFQVSVYTEGKINAEGKLNVTFHHYYTYELLHIQNTSDSDIEFSLLGFNGTLWYKEKGSLCLDDGSFVVDAPSTKQPQRESRPITIKPGESQVIVSAYIPNGNTINEATMVAQINGEYVYSSNTKSSGITLKQGHAYHMYAGWNGEELKFLKDADVPLDVRTLSATIDPQYLTGEFTGVVVNPPLSEIKTGFRIWKQNNPEDYVEYDSKASNGGSFSLDLTYNDFVYIANEGPVEGLYCVSAFAIDEKGSRHYGNTLEFTIDGGQPEIPVIPEPVDLGLPSGTKWSPYNIGATKPQEVGSYYAWGEISSKNNYDWSTYKHADGAEGTCHNIGDEISGSEYDVATNRWGQDWSMPTLVQVKELIMNSTLLWTTEGGVSGVKITSRINGNSIFMPVSGNRFETDTYDTNSCFSWTGTLKDGNDNLANQLLFYYSDEIEDYYASYGGRDRCFGLPVRPVCVGPEVATPEIVDLGLSVKWASFNLGATKPEEFGDYYAWGEIEPYYSSLDPLMWNEGKEAGYDWSSYKWCMGDYDALTKYCTNSNCGIGGFTDDKYELDPEDDAAHMNLRGKWRMPTNKDWNDIRKKCSWEWTSVSGVDGYKVTGPNGSSIFFPSAGYWSGMTFVSGGLYGFYWTATLSLTGIEPRGALCVRFGDSFIYGGDDTEQYRGRSFGFSIRPVYDDSEPEPEIKTPEPIDLGLPSGLKWASFNLGATKPEEFGDYYAWGETEPYYEQGYAQSNNPVWKEGKDEGYFWSSYSMGSTFSLTKYCTDSYYGTRDGKTVLESEDDAAYVNLGNKWRLPTDAEWAELIENCTWVWSTCDGVVGKMVTGKNGNSIFLPEAGYRSGIHFYRSGHSGPADPGGNYWSSSLNVIDDRSYYAWGLFFDSEGIKCDYDSRFYGYTIRPVYIDS